MARLKAIRAGYFEKVKYVVGESLKTEDKVVSVEQIGIEHVPSGRRHGSPGRVFTLWFAANLTIADYVIGVLVGDFGLTVLQAIPVLVLGNVLGGLVLGLSASMGPKLGFPQMMTSRSAFGRLGNYLPGALNWISTVGWFAVNSILGAIAIKALFPGLNLFAGVTILVLVLIVIAIYGHDFIQLFEKAMSVVLGLLFLAIIAISIPRFGLVFSYVPQTAPTTTIGLLGALGTTLAVCFSYIMSWSPYASDYSRYLPEKSSEKKVTLFGLAGGALASFASEFVGAIVGSQTGSSPNYFEALRQIAGSASFIFGIVAVVAIILGAVAANALNIYTNALSLLVLDVKIERWKAVLVGGVVGLVLSLYLGWSSFEQSYENFLLLLDYWIMPWLAIMIVDFFVLRRTSVQRIETAGRFDKNTIAVYLVAVFASIPFMALAPVRIILPNGFTGPVAMLLGGADFSYYVSFAIAGLLYFIYRNVTKDVASEPAIQTGH
jgi:NCS1 family nucleobase:cation symporter-1